MYDPALGRFFSQDRFTEKYYPLSQYQYAANNPIKYIDVNGDSIRITYNNQIFTYNNGSLYNSDGQNFDYSSDEFLNSIVGALGEIQLGGEEGSCFIDDIQNAEEDLTIMDANALHGINKGKTSYWKEHNAISINIKNRTKLPTTEGIQETPLHISLAHEMAHGLDDLRGTLDNSTWYLYPHGSGTWAEERNEIFSTHMENIIRHQSGLPLRTHYSINPNGTGYWPSRILLEVNSGYKSIYDGHFFNK